MHAHTHTKYLRSPLILAPHTDSCILRVYSRRTVNHWRLYLNICTKNNFNAVVLFYLHKLLSSQRGSIYLIIYTHFCYSRRQWDKKQCKYSVHLCNNSTEILENMFFTIFFLQLHLMRLMEGAPNPFGSKWGGDGLVMMSYLVIGVLT